MKWIGMEGEGAIGPALGTHCSRHRWAIGYTGQCYGQARTLRCTSNARAMPPSQKCQCLLVLLCNALQCAEEGGMGNGTGNAINSNVRVILDAGELNCSHYYISSHLTFTYLRLASFGSPSSRLFFFLSGIICPRPHPLTSHFHHANGPGATGGTSGLVAAV
jgi:hypothetical protein